MKRYLLISLFFLCALTAKSQYNFIYTKSAFYYPVGIGTTSPSAQLDVRGTFDNKDSNGYHIYTGYQYVRFGDTTIAIPSVKCQYVDRSDSTIYTAGVEGNGNGVAAVLSSSNPSKRMQKLFYARNGEIGAVFTNDNGDFYAEVALDSNYTEIYGDNSVCALDSTGMYFSPDGQDHITNIFASNGSYIQVDMVSGDSLVVESDTNKFSFKSNVPIYIDAPLAIPNNSGIGYILTSDSIGNASWQPAGGGTLQTVTDAGNATTNKIIVTNGGNVQTIYNASNLNIENSASDNFGTEILSGNNSGGNFIITPAENIHVHDTIVVSISGIFADSTGNINFASVPFYTNDAAADADSGLPSGRLYRITGNRTLFIKP